MPLCFGACHRAGARRAVDRGRAGSEAARALLSARGVTAKPPAAGGSLRRDSRLLPVALGPALEPGVLGEEDQIDRSDRAVALLGDDQLHFHRGVDRSGVSVVVAVDEHHHARVLLDRARLAQVGEHWFTPAALLDLAVQLAEREYRYVEH